MRGVVFTEFLDMVEARFGMDVVDRIIEGAETRTGGAYTSVGTYDHREMFALVGNLSTETGTPAPDLVRSFGEHLFLRFKAGYPAFFVEVPDALSFLSAVDGYIHIEVKKLYPDAELPGFTYERPDERTLVMHYRSPRGLADLAHGLIDGCIAYFGQPVSVAREDRSGGRGQDVVFTLTKG
jgi:hypothetical protein